MNIAVKSSAIGRGVFLGLILLTGYLIPGLAWAQGLPPVKKVMRIMDADGDGRISAEEWRKTPKAFRRIDRDGDGFITPDELGAFRKSRGSGGIGSGGIVAGRKIAISISEGAWIDTHNHLRKGSGSYSGAVEHLVSIMDDAKIQVAVLMPQPFPASASRNVHEFPQFLSAINAYPGRFIFLGGGGSINGIISETDPDDVTDQIRVDFTQKAEAIMAAGARGFGEMGMLHMSHFEGHPYYWVAPDHPLFLLLADIAGRHKAVIDVHSELVETSAPTPGHLNSSENPSHLKPNVAAFARFVAHNRDARIMLAHAGWDVSGQWTTELSRRLLTAHPNLFMSLKMTSRGNFEEHSPLTGFFSKSVREDWLNLFKDFPDRFVMGSENFVGEEGARGGPRGGLTSDNSSSSRSLLEALPKDLAEKIGFKNALRIYGIPTK